MSRSCRRPVRHSLAKEASLLPLQHAATFCFSIELTPEPGAMARVLEQFVKRGLLPTRWHSDVVEDGLLQIDIQMRALPAALGDDIARGLNAVIGVRQVLTGSKTGTAGGPSAPHLRP